MSSIDTEADGRNSGTHAGRSANGTFAPGNPGKKSGTRHRAAIALLEGEAEALTRKAVEMALAGDPVALRLCLDCLLPKGRAVRIDLPMATLAELDQAAATICGALADGSVTLDEVGTLTGLLETRRRTIEATELERRIAALEMQGDKR